MKTKTIGIGVAVLAALTLAGGSTSVAQTNDGFGGGDGHKAGHHKTGHHKAGHDIIVKGSHNQIVLGDDNIVARGDIENSTETETGEGEEAEAPARPYATVNNRVTSFLSERERPTRESAEVARFSRGTQVPIACFVPDGEPVDGNRTWYQVRADPPFVYGYISAHFADLTGAVQICPPTD